MDSCCENKSTELALLRARQSRRARAGATLVKGGFMLLFGVVVVADAIRKLVIQEVPAADWMGIVGALALLANGFCFAMLYRHRADDLNMHSTWLCSRNDLIANSSVIVAAGLVAVTSTLWPDIIVGLGIAALFLHSAWQVIRDATREWHASSLEQHEPSQKSSTKDPNDTACCPTQANGSDNHGTCSR